MRVYEGYGTGHPVYTIKGNQVYQGYGTGHPIYTIKGNQVYQGYGTGHPVYTIKGNQVYQGYGPVIRSIRSRIIRSIRATEQVTRYIRLRIIDEEGA